jgi:lysophospholipase L1-like esterase
VFRIVALLLPLALLFGAAELAVRLLVPAERWRMFDATEHWEIDPTLGWVQARNLDSSTVDLMTNEAVRLRANADGLLPASATREKAAGVTRILLVGDSTIVGASVNEEQRIHAVLERMLRESGFDVEVLNAATEGFATDQAMLRLEQLLDPYDPDVVLHGVCSNDFVANTLSRNHGLNKPSFRLDASGEPRADPFTPSDEVRQLGSGASAMIQRSALYRLLRPRLVVLRAKLGGWEERNLIGMASDWYHDDESLNRVDWSLFGALVERMQRRADEHGALFAAYLHPDVGATWDPVIEDTKSRIDPSAEFDRYALERRSGVELEGRGIAFVPLIRYFAERQHRGPFHLLPRNPHCNAEGYRMQAEALADYLAPQLIRP